MDSSDRKQRAFEDAAIGIAILAVEPLGKYLEVNPTFCRMTGYSRDELLNRDFQSITVSQDLKGNIEHCQEMLSGAYSSIQFEKRYIRKDGTSFWSRLNASLVRDSDDPDSPPHFFIVQIEDFDQRKQAEEQSHLRARVLHKLHEINLLPSLEEPLLFDKVTGAMASCFGVTTSSIVELGASELEVLSLWESGKTTHNLRFPLKGTPCENIRQFKSACQYRGVLSDLFPEDPYFAGKNLQSYLGCPIMDSQGKVIAIATLVDGKPRRYSQEDLEIMELFGQAVGTFLERKKLEEKLRHSHKLEAIGQLAGGVAHEFNNLLTTIIGNLELSLTREIKEEDRVKVLETAQKGAQRAVLLTKQLLTFGRRCQINREAHDIGMIAQDTVRLIRQTIDRKIELTSSIQENLWPVQADADQIHQVVMNLCVNARDAVEERERRNGSSLKTETRNGSENGPLKKPWQPRISVRAENIHINRIDCRSRPDARPGDFVCLKVKDNGSGISDEVRDHLFEPFFTTKPSGKGTGLGLATVYGIIKQHDGWIELSKDKTSGTTFQVFLPRTAKPSSRPKSEVRDLSRWKGDETILFVDDEQSIRLLGQTILERNGYTVIQAGDGMEAVQVFQKEHGRIGLVVLDLTMPYQSGEEVLKQIRKIEPDMRVIVSSGHTPSGDDSIVRRIHANGIIPKPYHPNELLKSVRTLLDHPTA